MLLAEPAKMLLLSLTSNIKAIQTPIDGLLLSARECASTPEDSTSNQVIVISSLASGIKEMHLDKSGAVSVFTAFQYIVREKVKINLTVSMGFV